MKKKSKQMTQNIGSDNWNFEEVLVQYIWNVTTSWLWLSRRGEVHFGHKLGVYVIEDLQNASHPILCQNDRTRLV